jgi:asparagine synthase (glutamine-hydrolysing)
MCGIAGLITTAGEPVDRAILERMCAAMGHRGPDAQGIALPRPSADRGTPPGVGFGHVRLSVIDLESGRQPMANGDESIWVTFNGEIYNFQELRRELEARGHRFRTRSDTEVILRAYEAYGEECVQRFRGMFAFALWDARRGRLFLARDRVGKKPLVYAERHGRFAFASELRGLLQVPWIERAMDVQAVHDYLTFLCVPSPRTIFQGVSKLPPAHCLSYEQGAVRIWRYWDLPFTPKRRISEPQAVEELQRLLEESVRLRLISDVPLGCLLSGGMDSSTVVALMAAQSSRPVKTFSIGFEESAFNELPYARLVAERFGTEHHEEIVRPDAVELLPKIVDHYGEPFADSSAVPSFYLSCMARRHVAVVLNGDGGDEAFGGYYRHLAMRWADRYSALPGWVRAATQSTAGRALAARLSLKSQRLNAARFIDAAGLPRAQRWVRWMGCFTEEAKAALYGGSPAATFEPSSRLIEQVLSGAGPLDGVDAALRADTFFYLPNDLLVKMDIASMAFGLEARSPLLDHELLEFAACLPASMKVRGVRLKWLLKRLGGKVLPQPVTRRVKQGFAVPLEAWFRGPLGAFARDVLLSKPAAAGGLFDTRAIQRLLDDHASGRAQYGHHLWTLIVFALWHRRFVESTDGFRLPAGIEAPQPVSA